MHYFPLQLPMNRLNNPNQMIRIDKSWLGLLEDEFSSEYFKELSKFVRNEYLSDREIYPKAKDIFAAFDKCPVENVKVVIIGQDPYHGRGQANGLCFSVCDGVQIPPSLQNIFMFTKQINENFWSD